MAALEFAVSSVLLVLVIVSLANGNYGHAVALLAVYMGYQLSMERLR